MGPFAVADGAHTLRYRSADRAEHVEADRKLAFKVDATAPVLSGLVTGCSLDATNELMKVAHLTAADALSGISANALSIVVTSNETLGSSDVVVKGGEVFLRASRSPAGSGRVYTIEAAVSDRAGNPASGSMTCTVPID